MSKRQSNNVYSYLKNNTFWKVIQEILDDSPYKDYAADWGGHERFRVIVTGKGSDGKGALQFFTFKNSKSFNAPNMQEMLTFRTKFEAWLSSLPSLGVLPMDGVLRKRQVLHGPPQALPLKQHIQETTALVAIPPPVPHAEAIVTLPETVEFDNRFVEITYRVPSNELQMVKEIMEGVGTLVAESYVRMNLVDRIYSWAQTQRGKPITTTIVEEAFKGINKNSVNSTLSKLYTDGLLERVTMGIYKLKGDVIEFDGAVGTLKMRAVKAISENSTGFITAAIIHAHLADASLTPKDVTSVLSKLVPAHLERLANGVYKVPGQSIIA